MTKLHSVVWSEGMFLTPLHFQAQDRCAENTLHFRSAASTFENWGVTELEIDPDSLANGTFTLRSCSGVLPDGLSFCIPRGDAPPPSRQVDPHFPVAQQSLDVFLAIRERQHLVQAVGNVETAEPRPGKSNAPRYIPGNDPIVDDNRIPDGTNQEPQPIEFAKRNFGILFDGESTDGFVLLRIAQIARRSTGGYALRQSYVAPCLDLSSSTYLMDLLKGRIEKLAARGSSIDARRREGIGTLGFQNAEDLWMLHTINSYLPGLRHIWYVRHGHPETAYMVLLHLAGALCSLTAGADPTQLPNYAHKDLGSCFAALDRRIGELLDIFSKAKCVEIPLTREGLFWIGSLPEEYYFRNSHFFLGVKASMGIPALISEGPQRIKIAAKEKIELLYQNALPGVSLLHESNPPAAIPARAGSQYFRLNQSGVLWNEIKQLKDIGIYVHHAIEHPEVQLLIALE